MENLKVFEFVFKYSTIMMSIVFIIYILAYIGVNKYKNAKDTTLSLFVKELHFFSRSIILIYVSFLFVQYMFLVEFGASNYFEHNTTNNSADYFKYLIQPFMISKH